MDRRSMTERRRQRRAAEESAKERELRFSRLREKDRARGQQIRVIETQVQSQESLEQASSNMDAICRVEDDREDQVIRKRPTRGDTPVIEDEFDFVESLSEDFFCPVTFELLLNPHQTTCCGNHLSEKAVDRLQREGKTCPICKEEKLETVRDKFFKRKTSSVLIRCPHKANGCEWVGEVGGSKQHIEACPKRAWECQHCDFKSTFEVGIQHEEECTKYPVPCPNKCEIRLVSQASPFNVSCETRIRTIPRCDIEKHRAECPLEVVACEFADVGCKVKTTRQDLKRHMEESQQEHLLTATLVNLRLTKETIAEKDRQLAEKDRQLTDLLAEKERQLAEKDRQLAEKERQLAELRAEKDRKLTKQDKTIAMKDSQILEGIVQLQQGLLGFAGTTEGFTCHRFTLEKFSECQKIGADGDWFSEPFNHDYNLKLNVETKERDSHMDIRLSNISKKSRGKVFVLALQMLNQQCNHNHFLRQFVVTAGTDFEWDCDDGEDEDVFSDPYPYVPFIELYKKDGNIQYLKDDCLKFVLWFKEKK